MHTVSYILNFYWFYDVLVVGAVCGIVASMDEATTEFNQQMVIVLYFY